MWPQAVFIDRDGTLGGTGWFIHPREFEPFPGVLEAISRLRAAAIPVYAFTNQGHLAAGDVTLDELAREFRRFGFDGWYVCPHHADEGCLCRKPSPYLLEQAAREHHLNLRQCVMVGDTGQTDMLAADRAGLTKVLVRTGWGEGSLGRYRNTWAAVEPDHVADALPEAVDWILEQREEQPDDRA
jgi:histidinol-phosphate phosphatase family protein